MYCGSGLYTDIPHSISNNVVLPVTLFLPLFPFPPSCTLCVSLEQSSVFDMSVFIPPEKCYLVYGVGCLSSSCGLWAFNEQPLYGSLSMLNPQNPPKKAPFSLTFTPNLLLLSLSWSWEMLTRFSPTGCNLFFTFQLFLSCFPCPPFHTAVELFFMMFPEQAALLTNPCPFLKSWDLPEGFSL